MSKNLLDTSDKLQEIADIIDKQTDIPSSNYSLFGGMAGELFFLYHYHKLMPGIKFDFSKKIDILIDSIKTYGINDITYCSGLSGVLYLFEIMKKDAFLEIKIGTDIHEYFNDSFFKLLKRGKYEFLYGLIGIAQLFCLNKDRYKNKIIDILHYLDDNKIMINNGFTWIDKEKKDIIYDLSLSHGTASVIVFLTQLLNDDLFFNYKKLIFNLLTKSIHFVMSQQINREYSNSYFPYTCNNNGPLEINSRLGWCYGDLSIGIALYQAAKVCNNTSLHNFSKEVLSYAANKRRNLKENSVIDAGLCHGTAGIAALFYRMWWNEKTDEYASATDYWINKTIEMAKYNNGPAGYLYYSARHGLIPAYHFLEGIAGIGIVLLYYLMKAYPSWDKCLLLSF